MFIKENLVTVKSVRRHSSEDEENIFNVNSTCMIDCSRNILYKINKYPKKQGFVFGCIVNSNFEGEKLEIQKKSMSDEK